MITIADVEDAYLYAQAEVQQVMSEVVYAWNKPLAQSFMGLAAANLRPEQIQGIPEGGIERIVEFALGGKQNGKQV